MSDIPTAAESGSPFDRRSPAFEKTHWSIVLQVSGEYAELVNAAIQNLCQTFWCPLYAFVRRRGCSSHDAEDLTKAFFAHLLDREALIPLKELETHGNARRE